MKHPWLFVLVLAVSVVAALIGWGRTNSREPKRLGWVSGTEHIRYLPSYIRARGKARTTALMGSALLLTLSISLAVSAGLPVDRKVEHPSLASRDIVLCLDASGSMLPYDGQILRYFSELVDNFEGERISLHLWSAQTIVRFPLTDDYDLADEVLTEAARIIDTGFLGPQGDYVLVTYELADYLEGIQAPDDEEISSLVGDGLATCVLGFDHLDQERSRTVILATDNEVMGPQIYTTAEAVEFAEASGVDIIVLYPGEGDVITAEGEQLRSLVEGAGGHFYNATDPASVDNVIGQIEQEQLAELQGAGMTVETDRPRAALLWSVWSLLALLTLAAVRRI